MNGRYKNLIWLVVILAAFTIYSFASGGTSTYLSFEGDAITVTAPESYTHAVNYDDIADVSLVDEFDAGTAVSGSENRRYYWGTWENNVWGEYTLCASKKIDNALVITTTSGDHLVVNYESESTTASLLELVNELLASRAGS